MSKLCSPVRIGQPQHRRALLAKVSLWRRNALYGCVAVHDSLIYAAS